MEGMERKLYRKYRSPLTGLVRDWKTFMGGYDDQVVRAATFDMSERYRLQDTTISSHFLMDAFQMHYRPYDTLVPNPLVSNSWKDLITGEMARKEYRELNEKTARNSALALLASQNFVDAIVNVARKNRNIIPPDIQQKVQQQGNQPKPQNPNNPQNSRNQQNQGNQPGQQQGGNVPFNFTQFMQALQMMSQGSYGNQAAASNVQGQMSSAAQQAASQSAAMGTVMDSFSHAGVPMKKLMDPDEMRSILSNRIVISLAGALKKLSVSDPGKSTTKPSIKRGIPIGVKSMRSFSEVIDLTPQEYLNDNDLFAYRVASRKALVRQRFSSQNQYLVYLDKSGSMESGMKFLGEYTPKIAVAAANALSLARYLKAHSGKMTLKLFDTEVQEPITDMWELLKTLASISADGGTNITNVLEDIREKGRDQKCVIISDGIDSIEEDAARAVSGMNVSSVLIRTSNPILEKYTNVTRIDEAGSENFLVEV